MSLFSACSEISRRCFFSNCTLCAAGCCAMCASYMLRLFSSSFCMRVSFSSIESTSSASQPFIQTAQVCKDVMIVSDGTKWSRVELSRVETSLKNILICAQCAQCTRCTHILSLLWTQSKKEKKQTIFSSLIQMQMLNACGTLCAEDVCVIHVRKHSCAHNHAQFNRLVPSSFFAQVVYYFRFVLKIDCIRQIIKVVKQQSKQRPAIQRKGPFFLLILLYELFLSFLLISCMHNTHMQLCMKRDSNLTFACLITETQRDAKLF